MREGTLWEVQYRNRADDPWQLLCDRDETRDAAERRIAGIFARYPESPAEYRIVKVTREPEAAR